MDTCFYFFLFSHLAALVDSMFLRFPASLEWIILKKLELFSQERGLVPELLSVALEKSWWFFQQHIKWTWLVFAFSSLKHRRLYSVEANHINYIWGLCIFKSHCLFYGQQKLTSYLFNNFKWVPFRPVSVLNKWSYC